MGGSSSKTKYSVGFDYYGTVLVSFANRVDLLRSIIIDETPVWTGMAARDTSPNPMVISTDRGDIHFYWGTDADGVHPDLLTAGNDYGHEHPPYNGVAKIVLEDYYFGRNVSAAPNIEIVADSAGEQTVVAGTAVDLDGDGQCNPIVCLANYLTDQRQGLGLDPSRLDTLSFQLAANALEADSDLKYITMFLDETLSFREFLQQLVQYVDFSLRLDADGLISIGLYPQNDVVDPETIEELSFADFDSEDQPELIPPSFDDLSTGWYVVYHDKERDYKQTSLSVDNIRMREMFAEKRTESLDRPWVVRQEQARALLDEWNRDYTQPRTGGSRVVRRSILDAKGLGVGSLFKMSVNPDPDGLALVQIFKLTAREDDADGLMTEIQFEAIDSDSVAVTVAGYVAPGSPAVDVPDLVDARVIELPPALADGEAFRLGFLAQRPAKSVVGVAVNYGTVADGFYEIGLQQSFAVKAALDADILAADLTFTIDLDVGVLDTELQQLVSPGDVAARDDALIAVLVKIDAGAIAEDADGIAVMELVSVVDLSTPAAGQRTLTLLRGRLGTSARDFLAADTEVWLVDPQSLRVFFHNDFTDVAEAPYKFRMATFNLSTRDQAADYLEIDYNFASERDFAPTVVTSGVTNNGWLDTLEWEFVYAAILSDVDSDMVSAQLKITPPTGEPQTFSYVPDAAEAANWSISQAVRAEPEGNYTFDLTVRDAQGNVTTEQTIVASGGIPWAYPELVTWMFQGNTYYLMVYGPSADLLSVKFQQKISGNWQTSRTLTLTNGQKTLCLEIYDTNSSYFEARAVIWTAHGLSLTTGSIIYDDGS